MCVATPRRYNDYFTGLSLIGSVTKTAIDISTIETIAKDH
jgi:hypothetical protein